MQAANPSRRRQLRPLREGNSEVVGIVSGAVARSRPVAVFVLGQVGAGKTTFLEYTKKVGAKDIFAQKAGKPYPHWLYVDFRTYVKDQPAIDFLCDELKKRINDDPFLSDFEQCIRHAYKEEIDAPLY